MVKIVDEYLSKIERAEKESRLYSLAEEMFGKDRCLISALGGIHIHGSNGFSVSIAPFLDGVITVREEADYNTALRFAEMAEGIVGKELILRTQYKRS